MATDFDRFVQSLLSGGMNPLAPSPMMPTPPVTQNAPLAQPQQQGNPFDRIGQIASTMPPDLVDMVARAAAMSAQQQPAPSTPNIYEQALVSQGMDPRAMASTAPVQSQPMQGPMFQQDAAQPTGETKPGSAKPGEGYVEVMPLHPNGMPTGDIILVPESLSKNLPPNAVLANPENPRVVPADEAAGAPQLWLENQDPTFVAGFRTDQDVRQADVGQTEFEREKEQRTAPEGGYATYTFEDVAATNPALAGLMQRAGVTEYRTDQVAIIDPQTGAVRFLTEQEAIDSGMPVAVEMYTDPNNPEANKLVSELKASGIHAISNEDLAWLYNPDPNDTTKWAVVPENERQGVYNPAVPQEPLTSEKIRQTGGEQGPAIANEMERAGIYEVPQGQMLVRDMHTGELKLVLSDEEQVPPAMEYLYWGGARPELSESYEGLGSWQDMLLTPVLPVLGALEGLDIPRRMNVGNRGEEAFQWATQDEATRGSYQGRSTGVFQGGTLDRLDPMQVFDTVVAGDFTDWVNANPDTVRDVYINGYTDEATGRTFTGGDAVWERFVNERPAVARAIFDIFDDPLNYIGVAGGGVRQLGRRALGEGAQTTLGRRLLGGGLDVAGRALQLPDEAPGLLRRALGSGDVRTPGAIRGLVNDILPENVDLGRELRDMPRTPLSESISKIPGLGPTFNTAMDRAGRPLAEVLQNLWNAATDEAAPPASGAIPPPGAAPEPGAPRGPRPAEPPGGVGPAAPQDVSVGNQLPPAEPRPRQEPEAGRFSRVPGAPIEGGRLAPLDVATVGRPQQLSRLDQALYQAVSLGNIQPADVLDNVSFMRSKVGPDGILEPLSAAERAQLTPLQAAVYDGLRAQQMADARVAAQANRPSARPGIREALERGTGGTADEGTLSRLDAILGQPQRRVSPDVRADPGAVEPNIRDTDLGGTRLADEAGRIPEPIRNAAPEIPYDPLRGTSLGANVNPELAPPIQGPRAPGPEIEPAGPAARDIPYDPLRGTALGENRNPLLTPAPEPDVPATAGPDVPPTAPGMDADEVRYRAQLQTALEQGDLDAASDAMDTWLTLTPERTPQQSTLARAIQRGDLERSRQLWADMNEPDLLIGDEFRAQNAPRPGTSPFGPRGIGTEATRRADAPTPQGGTAQRPDWSFATPDAATPGASGNRIIERAWTDGQADAEGWQQFVAQHDPKARAFVDQQRALTGQSIAEREGGQRTGFDYATEARKQVEEAEYVMQLVGDVNTTLGRNGNKVNPSEYHFRHQKSKRDVYFIEQAIFGEGGERKRAIGTLRARARRDPAMRELIPRIEHNMAVWDRYKARFSGQQQLPTTQAPEVASQTPITPPGTPVTPTTTYDDFARQVPVPEHVEGGDNAFYWAHEGYRSIGFNTNQRLREGRADTAPTATLRDFEVIESQAIPIPQDMVLWRGESTAQRAVPSQNVQVGDTFTDPALGSTTADEQIAVEFATGNQAQFGTPVVLRIQPGPGLRGTPLERAQQEVVLPRGTNYRVTAVTDRDGYRQVDVVATPGTAQTVQTGEVAPTVPDTQVSPAPAAPTQTGGNALRMTINGQPYEIRAVPVSEIRTARELTPEQRQALGITDYQMRNAEFAEETARNVRERFDVNQLDPVKGIIANDGNIYVTSGHSRLQGFKDAGYDEIPVHIQVGEAEDIARSAALSNSSATGLKPIEDGLNIRRLIAPKDEGGQGMTIQQVVDSLPNDSRTKVDQKIQASYIDPNTDLGRAVDKGDLPLNKAAKIGKAIQDNKLNTVEADAFYRSLFGGADDTGRKMTINDIESEIDKLYKFKVSDPEGNALGLQNIESDRMKAAQRAAQENRVALRPWLREREHFNGVKKKRGGTLHPDDQAQLDEIEAQIAALRRQEAEIEAEQREAFFAPQATEEAAETAEVTLADLFRPMTEADAVKHRAALTEQMMDLGEAGRPQMQGGRTGTPGDALDANDLLRQPEPTATQRMRASGASSLFDMPEAAAPAPAETVRLNDVRPAPQLPESIIRDIEKAERTGAKVTRAAEVTGPDSLRSLASTEDMDEFLRVADEVREEIDRLDENTIRYSDEFDGNPRSARRYERQIAQIRGNMERRNHLASVLQENLDRIKSGKKSDVLQRGQIDVRASRGDGTLGPAPAPAGHDFQWKRGRGGDDSPGARPTETNLTGTGPNGEIIEVHWNGFDQRWEAKIFKADMEYVGKTTGKTRDEVQMWAEGQFLPERPSGTIGIIRDPQAEARALFERTLGRSVPNPNWRQVDEELRAATAPRVGTLSSADRMAASRYTGPAFADLNMRLRNGEVPDWVDRAGQETMRVLDNAMQTQVPQGTMLYRGIRGTDAPQYLNLSPGDEITDGGYMSTSLDRDHAMKFANKRDLDWNAPTPRPVILELAVDPEVRGAYMSGTYSMARNEAEFVLPRGSRMVVADVRRIKDGALERLEIQATVLPPLQPNTNGAHVSGIVQFGLGADPLTSTRFIWDNSLGRKVRNPRVTHQTRNQFLSVDDTRITNRTRLWGVTLGEHEYSVLTQTFDDGESILSRIRRYTDAARNEHPDWNEKQVRVAAANRVFHDWNVQSLRRVDAKKAAIYESTYDRLMEKKNADQMNAQLEAMETAMGRDRRQNIYDTYLGIQRELKLYNPITGTRYVATQAVGNTITALLVMGLRRGGQLAREALGGEQLRSTLQDVRNTKPTFDLFDPLTRVGTMEEWADEVARTPGATLDRTDRMMVEFGYVEHTDVMRMTREEMMGLSAGGAGSFRRGTRVADSVNRLRLGQTKIPKGVDRATRRELERQQVQQTGRYTGWLASEWIRDVAGMFDLTYRKATWAHVMDASVSGSREDFFRQMRELLPDGADVNRFDELVATLPPHFGPKRIRETLGEFGDGYAERMARDWKNALSRMDKVAREEVRRLFFSGEETKLDAVIRRVFMFHYWASRATPLYTEALMRNPGVLNAYLNMLDAAERQAESGEYGTAVKGMLQVMKTWFGYNLFIRPDAFMQTMFTIGNDQRFENEGESGLWKLLDNVGLMPSPMIDAFLNMTGYQGQNSFTPDLLGMSSHFNFASSMTDLVKSKLGMDVSDPTMIGPETILANVRASISGELPGSVDVDLNDPTAYARIEINNNILDIAGERGLDWDDPEDRVIILAAMEDPDSELYRAAFDRYATSNAVEWGLRVVPVSAVAYPKVRQAGADERRRQINELPPGSDERQSLLDQRQAATTLDNQTRTLRMQQDEYQRLGSPEGQEAYRTYNAIRFGDIGVIEVAGQTIQESQLRMLSLDERTVIADAWAEENGVAEAVEEAKELRKQYRETHPEYAQYYDWSMSVRDHEGGAEGYWNDLIAGDPPRNPNAARWYRENMTDDMTAGDVERELTGINAYMAQQGLQHSGYDPVPINTNSGNIPYDPAMQGGTGQGERSSSSDPAQQIRDDIATYEQESREIDAQLAARFGEGTTWQTIENANPTLQAALLQHMDTAGIPAPSLTRRAQAYLDWVDVQPQGSDTSVEAYLRWKQSFEGNSDAGLSSQPVGAFLSQ